MIVPRARAARTDTAPTITCPQRVVGLADNGLGVDRPFADQFVAVADAALEDTEAMLRETLTCTPPNAAGRGPGRYDDGTCRIRDSDGNEAVCQHRFTIGVHPPPEMSSPGHE